MKRTSFVQQEVTRNRILYDYTWKKKNSRPAGSNWGRRKAYSGREAIGQFSHFRWLSQEANELF